jgi:transposase
MRLSGLSALIDWHRAALQTNAALRLQLICRKPRASSALHQIVADN